MMRDDDRRAAEELKRRLLAAGVPVLEMRVFGSRARGDARPDSDLDVFLVLGSRSREIERAVDRIAWEVGYETGRVIMTFECTRGEMERLPLRAAPLLGDVRREGVPV
jgi:predicted nucleotidyltransferase